MGEAPGWGTQPVVGALATAVNERPARLPGGGGAEVPAVRAQPGHQPGGLRHRRRSRLCSAGVFAGLILLADRVLEVKGSVAVAVATLVIAALFNPLRRRVQRVVDRRFNRSRYDAEAVVADFQRPAPSDRRPGCPAVRPARRDEGRLPAHACLHVAGARACWRAGSRHLSVSPVSSRVLRSDRMRVQPSVMPGTTALAPVEAVVDDGSDGRPPWVLRREGSAREKGLSAIELRLDHRTCRGGSMGIRRAGALTLKRYCVAIVIKIILCYY